MKRIKIRRDAVHMCGHATYWAECDKEPIAMIRYFTRKACIMACRPDLPSHWAVLWVSGRTDQHNTFREARDNVLKGSAAAE